jgi:hypothetical protein
MALSVLLPETWKVSARKQHTTSPSFPYAEGNPNSVLVLTTYANLTHSISKCHSLNKNAYYLNALIPIPLIYPLLLFLRKSISKCHSPNKNAYNHSVLIPIPLIYTLLLFLRQLNYTLRLYTTIKNNLLLLNHPYALLKNMQLTSVGCEIVSSHERPYNVKVTYKLSCICICYQLPSVLSRTSYPIIYLKLCRCSLLIWG